MKVLLDTCALIWFLRDDAELSKRAASVIEEAATEAFVSAASIWELAIKARLGKLDAPKEMEATLEAELVGMGFTILPIAFRHAAGVFSLPLVHQDPFDRLLISQCRVENLVAITDDSNWKNPQYGIEVLW